MQTEPGKPLKRIHRTIRFGENVSKSSSVDISELREALGTIIASYTYLYDPFAIIKETDIVIRYETAMLDAKGRWDTYKDTFARFRKMWADALQKYNQITGDWKDAWIICSKVLDGLMRIAVKEELISLSRDMFNLSNTDTMKMPAGGGFGMPSEVGGFGEGGAPTG